MPDTYPPPGAHDPLAIGLPGNRRVRARLAELADRGRLHPCLLFEGPGGVGKADTARWLARLVNCEAEARPCGACWSCRRIAEGNHPDVIEVGLDPERTAPIISVAQARDLIGRLTLRPYSARRRFVIIDPADAMNAAAANALLKTFEEPPADTGFVLVTSQPSRLLATVRSRSQRVRFGPVAEADLVPWLQERGVDDPVRLARLSEGCPRRALALAEGEATARREARDAVIEALAAPMDGIFKFSEKLTKGDRASWTERALHTLDALDELCRDALVLLSSGADARLYNDDRPELVRAWAALLDRAGALAVADAVAAARRDLDLYVNPRLLVDNLVVQVAAQLGRDRTRLSAAG